MNLPQGEYVIYLRKSRADLEAEARGEGETLAKHKSSLLKFASTHNLNITEIFEEVVSTTERLSERTEMLRLLDLINDNPPAGVLVMDQDRLSRGSMQEQGFILDTFRSNNVLIVSPHEILDLNDESDEFRADISSLFARRELKMITRRMQRGRDISAENGNYVGAKAPYGYDKVKIEGGITLAPNDKADILRMMFQWYDEGMSTVEISEKLTNMNIPTYTGKKEWNFNVIIQILKNPVYIGRIQFRKTTRKKAHQPYKKYDIKKRAKEKIIDVPGKHPPLIDKELFDRVQIKLKENKLIKIKKDHEPVNALAGIVRCGKCGYTLVLKRHFKYPENVYLICNNKLCDNRMVRLDHVEEKIINFLREWIKNFKLDMKARKPRKSTSIVVKEQLIQELIDQLKLHDEQRQRQFDLLEQGVYDQGTFLERSKALSARSEEATAQLQKLKEELEQERERIHNQIEVVPKIEHAIKYYLAAKDVKKKNMVLKEILHEVKFWKEKNQRDDEFTIEITPKFSG